MDVTFEHPFAEPRDATRGGRLGRSLLIGAIFGSLAVWGATTAIAVRPTGGFVHDPVSLATRGGTMFSVPPLAPGQSVTRYATVATTGPASSLRLYGEVSGTGLALPDRQGHSGHRPGPYVRSGRRRGRSVPRLPRPDERVPPKLGRGPGRRRRAGLQPGWADPSVPDQPLERPAGAGAERRDRLPLGGASALTSGRRPPVGLTPSGRDGALARPRASTDGAPSGARRSRPPAGRSP